MCAGLCGVLLWLFAVGVFVWVCLITAYRWSISLPWEERGLMDVRGCRGRTADKRWALHVETSIQPSGSLATSFTKPIREDDTDRHFKHRTEAVTISTPRISILFHWWVCGETGVWISTLRNWCGRLKMETYVQYWITSLAFFLPAKLHF